MKSEKVFMGDVELSLDEQIEYAEFNLHCAIDHLNELLAKQRKEEAHIDAQYQAHVDAEFGGLCIESDKHDKEIEECIS